MQQHHTGKHTGDGGFATYQEHKDSVPCVRLYSSDQRTKSELCEVMPTCANDTQKQRPSSASPPTSGDFSSCWERTQGEACTRSEASHTQCTCNHNAITRCVTTSSSAGGKAGGASVSSTLDTTHIWYVSTAKPFPVILGLTSTYASGPVYATHQPRQQTHASERKCSQPRQSTHSAPRTLPTTHATLRSIPLAWPIPRQT